MEKEDLKDLAYWALISEEGSDVLVLAGKLSLLQIVIFPPGYLDSVSRDPGEEKGWRARLMDSYEYSTLVPFDLACGDSLDEVLSRLKPIIERHEKAVEMVADVLSELESVGITLACSQEQVLTDLTGGFVSDKWHPKKDIMLGKIVFGWFYAGDIRVDRSKYDRSEFVELLKNSGVENSEIEARLPMFENWMELDESD